MSIAAQVIGLPAGVALSLSGTVATGLTAAGTTQANALNLPAATNAISTAAASTGVVLNPGTAGDQIMVYNGGASTINIFPPVGGTINNLSANTAITVATVKSAVLVCRDSLNFFSILSA